MAATYTPIATTTLSSNQNSVTFSSISSAYTDLIVVFNGSISAFDYIYMQVGNGSVDTNSNYSGTILYGNGSSAGSSRYSNGTYSQIIGWTTGIQNNANSIININNYSNTTTYKTFLARTNDAANGTQAFVGLWRSTSAINTITFTGVNSRTIQAGSTFTLYGILSA